MSPFVVAAVAVVTLLLTFATTLGVRMAWRVGQNAQTITNYRDAATSWEASATALRTEVTELGHRLDQTEAECARTLAAAQTTIDTLTVKVQVLSDEVTGRSAINDMTAALTARIDTLRTELLAAIGGTARV